MTLLIVFFGFLFGAILRYARLNRFDVISGFATGDDYTVPKAILLAVGIGAIILNVEIALGLASYNVKPFLLGGVISGGIIFGTGMAILGYCPGTLAISAGEGSGDAFLGILGGLFGGWVYTLALPFVHGILGPDLGKVSLNSLTGNGALFFILMTVFALLFAGVAFWLPDKKRESGNRKWIVSGILLAVLNPVVFLNSLTGRPVGASTSYPYVANVITNNTENNYFEKIAIPGNWELYFLAGAFLAGLIISLIKKDFTLTMIHPNWEKYKGKNTALRAIWAFAGGFILIFGARMAGGCTSGHILSGGMQLAVSSIVFALFVFVSVMITGKMFYRKK